MKRATSTLKLFLLALTLFCAQASLAQTVAVKDVPARPADVGTLDGLVRAFYEVVNIAPEEARQWDRDRTLYVPWVRFIATSIDAAGKTKATLWTHQQYVEATEPLVQAGFKEWEISRTTRRYGNIAHIDSIYEGEALTGEGKTDRFRGLNSIEAYFDGNRWWISGVTWMSESPDHPIPAAYFSQRPAASGGDNSRP